MIELIRDWLVGITCGAIIVALADGLSPNGTVRKIGRLTGSLVLVLAMIQPVLRIDSRTFAGILTEYRVEAMGTVDELEEENSRLMKDIIADETCAYILDKAEEMHFKINQSAQGIRRDPVTIGILLCCPVASFLEEIQSGI